MKKLFYLFALSAFTFSCSSSTSFDQDSTIVDVNDPYLLVVNEGNWGYSNSDISYITKNEEVVNDLFQNNNGRAAGDVAQSVTKINNYYYIAVSNSSKIEVISADNFGSIATIEAEGMTPQYILQTGASEAIVSDLYSTELAILDLSYNRVLSYKEVGAGTGRMLLTSGCLYVAKYNSDSWCYDNIMVLDAGSLSQVAEIETPGMGKSDILVDSQSKIWAMTAEGFVRVDPSTNTIEKRVTFPSEITSVWDSHCGITSDYSTIVFSATVDGQCKVYSFDIGDSSVGEAIFTATEIEGYGAYGLAVSPDDQIFITDAVDYSSDGKVYEYNFEGEVVNGYTVGINPQYMIFVD